MAPRVVDRERKRQELVEAAARVFARQGFVHTRMAAIAEEAGVGKGTVYQYFASREELFFAVTEWINERTWRQVQEVMAIHESAHDQLVGLLEVVPQLVVEHLDVHGVTLDFWAAVRASSCEDRLAEATRHSYRIYRDLVAGLVRRGQDEGELRPEVDPVAIATMLVGAFDGLCNQRLFDPSVDAEQSWRGFAQVLLAGLRREE